MGMLPYLKKFHPFACPQNVEEPQYSYTYVTVQSDVPHFYVDAAL
jgi:hypothetical protein